MITNNRVRRITRISGTAFCTILLLALCASLFSQSRYSAASLSLLKADKVERAPQSPADAQTKTGSGMPAVGQFVDEANGATDELTRQNLQGAVPLASRFSQNSGLLTVGARWIADPGSIKPFSKITGKAILWGCAILWGD